MKKEKQEVYEIDIQNPFKNKTFVKFLAGAVVVGMTVVGTYIFADRYTVDFRSPVIFQSPVVVQERLISPNPVELEVEPVEVQESTSSAEVEEKEVAFSPSQRLVAHSAQRPDIYGLIKKIFGDDSMVMGELLSRESSLNPTAINPTSGACGLGQALPCSKMPCKVSEEDAECQLEWVKEYVESRYGDAHTALAFHDRNGWY